MKNNAKFFCNKECEYFPCHKTNDSDNYNCMFCYCPLYHLTDCGGNYILTKDNIKDCSKCLIPHNPLNYSYLMNKLKEYSLKK